MANEWSNLLSGLVGAVVGGIASIVGSYWTTREARRQGAEEADRQQAAIMTALYIESEQLNAWVEHVEEGSPLCGLPIDLPMHDNVASILPLLPADVIAAVSLAWIPGRAFLTVVRPIADPEALQTDSIREMLKATKSALSLERQHLKDRGADVESASKAVRAIGWPEHPRSSNPQRNVLTARTNDCTLMPP